MCYHYGVLSGHCLAAENYEKGAEYSRLEAKRYQKAGFYKDAIEYAKKSITCLEQFPQTEANQKKVIDARTTLANSYTYMNYHSHAKEAVEPILDLALALNYRKGLSAIYTAIGLHYLWVEEDSHKGLALIDQAMAIAKEVADYHALWTALYISAPFLFMISEFNEAHNRLKQCLDFSLMAKNPMGIAYSKGNISMCYQCEGKMNPAHEFAQETLQLAQETGDAWVNGMAYSAYGAACYQKGLFDEAKTHLMEFTASYEKSAPIAWMLWAYGHLGSLHLDLREYDDAVNVIKKSRLSNTNIRWWKARLSSRLPAILPASSMTVPRSRSDSAGFRITCSSSWRTGEILGFIRISSRMLLLI